MMPRAFLMAAACLSAQPTFAQGAEAEGAWALDGSLALVSDYRWRGISLSGGDPSLQAEATLSHESGIWLWGGANSVDASYGGTELGAGAGWAASAAGLDWSLGLIQYVYPGEDGLDYFEADLQAGLERGPYSFAAGIEYVPPQDNYGEDFYAWASAERALSEHIALHGQIGLDRGTFASDPDQTTDYAIGLRANCGRASIDFSYVEAAQVDHALVARIGYGF